MRKFNIFIIVLAMTFCLSVIFGNETAEARKNRRNVCTCATPNGTMFRGCPKHGNVCIGLPAHEHEDTRARKTGFKTFCKVGKFKSLENSPTCDNFKERVRLAKKQQAKANRTRKSNNGLFANILGDNYVTRQYDSQVRRNFNRIKSRVRRNIREDARRQVDCWFGICR